MRQHKGKNGTLPALLRSTFESCSQKRQFKGRYETFVMLKRIRTITRSTSVEVYDREIAITVEEHCLDFTAHFDSVCTVSIKNIRTVLNFVCRTSFSNKKKKKQNESIRYVCILTSPQNNFQKRKKCDTCSNCEDINKYVANGKNICAIDIRTVTAS